MQSTIESQKVKSHEGQRDVVYHAEILTTTSIHRTLLQGAPFSDTWIHQGTTRHADRGEGGGGVYTDRVVVRGARRGRGRGGRGRGRARPLGGAGARHDGGQAPAQRALRGRPHLYTPYLHHSEPDTKSPTLTLPYF